MTAFTKVATIYLVKVVLVIISGHRQKDLYLFLQFNFDHLLISISHKNNKEDCHKLSSLLLIILCQARPILQQ